MPTTSAELNEALAKTVTLIACVVEYAAAMEALIAKGEAGRARRSLKKIEVLEVTLKDDRIQAVVRGVTDVYNPRITVKPHRSFACNCPDSQRQAVDVGPCKHTIALARYWLAGLEPRMEHLRVALAGLSA